MSCVFFLSLNIRIGLNSRRLLSPRPPVQQRRTLQRRAVLCAGGVEVREAGHLALQGRRTGGVRRHVRRVTRASHLLALVLPDEPGRVVGHDHDIPPLLVKVLRGGGGGRVVAAALTRLAVLHQHRHGHPPRGLLLLTGAAVLLHLLLGHFVFGLPLHLVPVILKPDFHLGRGEVDHTCQVFPLWRREVLLLLEAALQLVDLRLGEQHPSFSPRGAGQRAHAFTHVRQGAEAAHAAHVHARWRAHEARNWWRKRTCRY